MVKLITTSWDDGHEADFRVADLLTKYGLKGTFYIPRKNAENPVMTSSQVRLLSEDFEIGGHTLNHTRLHHLNDASLQNEVEGSFHWIADVTGRPPVSFCFPGGIYNRRAVRAAFSSGYKFLRTTELLSIAQPDRERLFPTTIQLYPHSRMVYLKHLLKRRKWKNLIQWMTTNSTADLKKLTENYLNRMEANGGCFHLWGHSWEIEENNLWEKLEEIFQILTNRPASLYVENGSLTQE